MRPASHAGARLVPEDYNVVTLHNVNDEPAVRIETRDRITTVIMARSHVRNAIDAAAAAALADAFRAFDRDNESDVAVLWGDGGSFCSGADLKSIAAGTPNRVAADGDAPMGPSRMVLSKPVIAAISGYAVAGGLELALWCDLRVAEEDAVLGVFNRRHDIPLIDGGTVRLPRTIGLGRALDLIMTGRAVAATEALAIGLVDRVVPKGAARAAAEGLAKEIAAYPQSSLKADRFSAYAQSGRSLEDAMRIEIEGGMRALKNRAPRDGGR